MLEKLRENPSAVVAGLVAAGVLAIAVGAGGNSDTENSTDTGAQDATSSEVAEAENQPEVEAAVDPEVVLDEEQEAAVEELVENEPEQGPVVVSKEDTTLSAVVRKGDNQTLIVRQMVDDFAAQSGQSLSAEQRLYVETNVVNTIPRNDLIFADDVIEIDETVVSDYVAMSRDLSDEQLARWSVYL